MGNMWGGWGGDGMDGGVCVGGIQEGASVATWFPTCETEGREAIVACVRS